MMIRVSLFLAMLALSTLATAQSPPAMQLISDSGSSQLNPSLDEQTSTQVLERLNQMEAEIAALRAANKQQSSSTSQDRDPESEPGLMKKIGDHFREAADPEIFVAAQQSASGSAKEKEKEKSKEKKWYDKLSVRGYTQFRLNEVLEQDNSMADPHHVGDRSVSDEQNFLIRRARLILSGDVSDRMFVYLQPDFASSVPNSPDATYFAQIRDFYADLYIDPCKVNRIRVGQSKVPYGWENMQSSSNRLPLDRNDALNSSVRNERDLGVFYYWTPEPAQDFFKDVLDKGLKGSGNYGVFAFGAYNGQGGSFVEQNESMHLVTRLTIPVILENGQHVEYGVQGYTGEYTVLSSQIRALGAGAAIRPNGTLETGNIDGVRDERIGGSLIWYPEPFGFQSEWNVGRGPALNAAQTDVEERALYGGYAMIMHRTELDNKGSFIPFVRWNYFKGGYKSERNAPFANIDEWETGFEWQFNPQMELTMAYTFTDRTNTTAINEVGVVPYQQFDGQILRMQFQFNY
jgi:hypothetical protein